MAFSPKTRTAAFLSTGWDRGGGGQGGGHEKLHWRRFFLIYFGAGRRQYGTGSLAFQFFLEVGDEEDLFARAE